MSKWIIWIFLTLLTGSPITALILILVIYWLLDRFTVQILPDPIKGLARWRRANQLRATIGQNPHDRRARRELADILVQQRRFQKALEILAPAFDAGDTEAGTLFLAGVAAAGTGQHDKAEQLFDELEEDNPKFRMGAIDLERGKSRLARGQHDGALECLRAFTKKRPGSIEGKVWLARALSASGDSEGARDVRKQAWQEFKSLPFFKQRGERFWAWRANPTRPIMYAILIAVGLGVGAYTVSTVSSPFEIPEADWERMYTETSSKSDARSWLARTSSTTPRFLGARDHATSLAYVDQLYSLGAESVDVWAIHPTDNKGWRAFQARVGLPDDKSVRTTIIDFLNESRQTPDTVYEYAESVLLFRDKGQKYLYVPLHI